MKPKFLFFIFLLFIKYSCCGQTTFQRIIFADSGCSANCVQQTNDNGYIIAGYTLDTIHLLPNIYIIKVTPEGEITWTKRFKASWNFEAESIQQTKDGGYIILCIPVNMSGFFYVIKTTAIGDTLWTRMYGNNYIDGASFVQQTFDGGYIIGGGTDVSGALGACLIKIDANGNIEWTKNYKGLNFSYIICVKQTSDSGFVFCGNTSAINSHYIYLVKTKANGDTVWTKAYGSGKQEQAFSVSQTFDSGFVILGITAGFGVNSWAPYVIKTNFNGDTIWSKIYTSNCVLKAYDIQQTLDNGYIITGEVLIDSYGRCDILLMKVNYNGDVLWVKNYGWMNQNSAISVKQTIDGGFIAVGQSSTPNIFIPEIYLIKTDSYGFAGCNPDSAIGDIIANSVATPVILTNTIITSGNKVQSCTVESVNSNIKDSIICISVIINEPNDNKTISLYPNPVQNEFRIRNVSMTKPILNITNMLGLTVFHSEILNSEIVINTSMLIPGIYFINIQGKKESWTGKFVKV